MAKCLLARAERRVEEFLTTSRKTDSAFDEALTRILKGFDSVLVFGGLPRDLLRGQPEAFLGDVDVVVAGGNGADLGEVLAGLCVVRNSLGGVRIHASRPELDIWDLPSTWAFAHGKVKCAGVGSLMHTTFFTVDSLLYDVRTGKLLSTQAARRAIRDGIVDLNLPENPNVACSSLNILRMVTDRGLRISPRLVDYFVRNVAELGVDALVKEAHSRSKTQHISHGDLASFYEDLRRFQVDRPSGAFPPRESQVTFPW